MSAMTFLAVALLSQSGSATAMPYPDRTLVWSDEFSVDGKPDPQLWSYEKGAGRNNEAQFFVDDRILNAFVKDGYLNIQARKGCWDVYAFTSASLHSKQTVSRGLIEVRAKFASGRGLINTIWTFGEQYPKQNWPDCGEIMLGQLLGHDPTTISQMLNTPSFNDLKDNAPAVDTEFSNATTSFHTFGTEIFDDKVVIYLDGKKKLEFTRKPNDPGSWPFDQPQKVFAALSAGGDLGLVDGFDLDMFPKVMQVDYVRVYAPRLP